MTFSDTQNNELQLVYLDIKAAENSASDIKGAEQTVCVLEVEQMCCSMFVLPLKTCEKLIFCLVYIHVYSPASLLLSCVLSPFPGVRPSLVDQRNNMNPLAGMYVCVVVCMHETNKTELHMSAG